MSVDVFSWRNETRWQPIGRKSDCRHNQNHVHPLRWDSPMRPEISNRESNNNWINSHRFPLIFTVCGYSVSLASRPNNILSEENGIAMLVYLWHASTIFLPLKRFGSASFGSSVVLMISLAIFLWKQRLVANSEHFWKKKMNLPEHNATWNIIWSLCCGNRVHQRRLLTSTADDWFRSLKIKWWI